MQEQLVPSDAALLRFTLALAALSPFLRTVPKEMWGPGIGIGDVHVSDSVQRMQAHTRVLAKTLRIPGRCRLQLPRTLSTHLCHHACASAWPAGVAGSFSRRLVGGAGLCDA